MTTWERFYYGVIAIGLVVFLGGCETVKAVSDACREGLCR